MNVPRFIRSAAFSVGLLLVTIAFTGCIEWDHQVVRYRYDHKTDTLLIFQDYRGIYGADKKEQLSDNEKEQIKSVLEGQRTFFFANWIFEISRESLRDSMAEMRDRSGDTVAEDDARLAILAAMEIFEPSFTIKNGDFYHDQEGRLSAVQSVSIRNVSKILPLVNEAIRAAYKAEARKKVDNVEAQLSWNRVADGKWTFIRFVGNQVQLKLPGNLFEEDVDLKDLKNSGVQIGLVDSGVTATMGRPDDKFTTVAHDPFEKTYGDNLLKHLQGKVKIRKTLDVEKQAKNFLLKK